MASDGRKKSQKESNATAEPLGKHFSKKHVALLLALCHADARQRVALLRTADKNLIKCICECALNVLHGVVELKDSQKIRLKKHKKILRVLTKKSEKSRGKRVWNRRKKTLIQSGGSFLPILLSPLIDIVMSKIIG